MSNILIFDRSNLDENVAWSEAEGNITRRQDLERGGIHRGDIVMWNRDEPHTCSCGHEHTRNDQTVLEVSWTGLVGNLEILDQLTPEQRERVEGIAARMRANAEAFPPAASLIRGRRPLT